MSKLRKERWRSDPRCFGSKEGAQKHASFSRTGARKKNSRIRKVGRHWRIQDFF